jgi:serine/threonine protein kinase/DNA-binding winged helix-turn-helix (wHTH) protein
MDVHASSATSSSAERSWRRWHFGRCVLDERTHELLVDHVDAEIERKPLEILIYLLQHAGEICTKDELLAGVWPGRILSETVLTKCVGRLRDVLADETQEIIKTAYGFGYRFVAAVRVETTAAPEPVRFDIRPGMHPPARPLWSLVERLGGGGHGEAWRARHDKTGEQRVFKFALEETALVALKREITLFRVINDTLGENARVVKLLDWNLEHLPYFVEAEFIAGGSLVDWVAVRGGVSGMSVSDRLEVVAKIADALSAVHSVGVLHKDLKPSNILVKPLPGNAIDIVLADFGSGGVLDFNRLEALGITRLGFTKTIATPEMTSGTPLYLAPEILAGQPFTVKSDIYALGIILYQFLAGDFHKVMSAGWERGIEDELLREDIALMAEGNPAERLGDAEGLARRLRSLDERRRHLIAERETQARAERARRLMERAQARRFGLILAFAALVVGFLLSTTLYFKARQSQERSEVAAAQSKAVTEFLSKDVFAPVSSQAEPVKDMTVIELLQRAGNEIDRRFVTQPDLAAELHFVIGRSFQSFLETSLAVKHFHEALDLGEHLSGSGSKAAMRSASELIQQDYFVGHLANTIDRYNTILLAGRQQFGENIPEVLNLRMNLARGRYLLGDWKVAQTMFEGVLTDVAIPPNDRNELLGLTNLYYGQLLTDLAQPVEAQDVLRRSIEALTLSLGEKSLMVGEAHSAFGRALADAGRFSDASTELTVAHELVSQWAPKESWSETRPRLFRALLLLHEDEPAAAEPLLLDIVGYEDATEPVYLEKQKDLTPELDHTGPARQALGEVYMREGRPAEAIKTLRQAVIVGEQAYGSRHPWVLSIQLSLAEALIADHRNNDARDLVSSIRADGFSVLPATHPIVAQWYRVKGLLDLNDNNFLEARRSLTRALDVYQATFGPNDWRVVRAQHDLQLQSKTGSRP